MSKQAAGAHRSAVYHGLREGCQAFIFLQVTLLSEKRLKNIQLLRVE